MENRSPPDAFYTTDQKKLSAKEAADALSYEIYLNIVKKRASMIRDQQGVDKNIIEEINLDEVGKSIKDLDEAHSSILETFLGDKKLDAIGEFTWKL
jgi:hypothetical protein